MIAPTRAIQMPCRIDDATDEIIEMRLYIGHIARHIPSTLHRFFATRLASRPDHIHAQNLYHINTKDLCYIPLLSNNSVYYTTTAPLGTPPRDAPPLGTPPVSLSRDHHCNSRDCTSRDRSLLGAAVFPALGNLNLQYIVDIFPSRY